MFDNSVIRPIAAAIGAAALVFVLAPGVAFAKDPGSGQHNRHAHSHGTSNGAPIAPGLYRPAPPGRSPQSTSTAVPTRSQSQDPVAQLEAEIAALTADAQNAVPAERTALLAELDALQAALQLLQSGVVPPPVTPAKPPPSNPPPTRPSASPTPAQPSQTPASVPSPAELANPPANGPTVIRIGPSAAPALQPDGAPAASSAPRTPSGGAAPPVGPSASPSQSATQHEAGTQPIPGLSPRTTALLFWIIGVFAAGIMFLVLGAGYRGRRRA